MPYGTPGSVRSDFVSPNGTAASFEVKNYNLNNIPGLTSSIARQAIQRQANLPQGMQQNVIIDTRGQVLTVENETNILIKIINKTNSFVSFGRIDFKKDQ